MPHFMNKQQRDKADREGPTPEHSVGPDADQHGDEGFEFADLQDHREVFKFAENKKEQQADWPELAQETLFSRWWWRNRLKGKLNILFRF